jgi:hypothetical protein
MIKREKRARGEKTKSDRDACAHRASGGPQSGSGLWFARFQKLCYDRHTRGVSHRTAGRPDKGRGGVPLDGNVGPFIKKACRHGHLASI